jgi:hypothetical protein
MFHASIFFLLTQEKLHWLSVINKVDYYFGVTLLISRQRIFVASGGAALIYEVFNRVSLFFCCKTLLSHITVTHLFSSVRLQASV